jgi:hypothetical protein
LIPQDVLINLKQNTLNTLNNSVCFSTYKKPSHWEAFFMLKKSFLLCNFELTLKVARKPLNF